MKTLNNVFFVIGISLIFIVNYLHIDVNNEKNLESIIIETNNNNKTNKNDLNISKSKIKIISKDELLKMNSHLESNGKWNVANKYGYIGKYQIGRLALMDLGYDINWINEVENSIYVIPDTIVIKKDTVVRKFYYFDLKLFPPSKQEEVIKRLLYKIETIYLKPHIKKYVGKEIDGVRITKAGILSASFLGFGYVDVFLKSNGKINPADGNGHTIKDRMEHFENYEVK